MALTVKHNSTNAITDWTQGELDAQIALGNYPPGTLLSQITKPSDWNASHTLTGSVAWGEITGTLSGQSDLQTALDAKVNTTTTVNGQALSSDVTITTISGNAGTATALQNARLIGNVSFDGTANITPTQIQPAAENSDTTCFPLFVNAASGTAQQPKYNSSLVFNASTGVLGATNLSGTNTGDQNLFSTIAVSGQSNIVADSTSDTLTIVAGTNITLTTDASTDSLTINATGGGSSPLTTKGDVWGFSTVDARIPIGTNGQVLTADSAQALGLKWATVAGTGDVVGPAASVDNAIVRFDGTTGKLIQDYTSGAPTIGDTGIAAFNNNVTIVGTGVITSASATAFVVGPNGTTNPALIVACNTASSDNGLTITGGSTGVILAVTGNDTNPTIELRGKGTGNVIINTQNSATGNVLIQSNGENRFTAGPVTSKIEVGSTTTASTIRFSVLGRTESSLTAGAEAPLIYFDLSQTRGHASNTIIALQRDFRITGSAQSFATSGGVITNDAVVSIDGFGQTGTNATMTNAHGLYIPTQAAAGTVTNMYALTVAAPTGGGTKNLAINASGLSELGTVQNTRINPRVNTITSSATPTPAGDTTDEFTVTAQAAGATFAAPTGTPVEGQKLMIRIKDNGSAQTLAWNAIYRAGTDVALPTTTVISKTMYLGFVYNATDSKWDLLASIGNI